MTQNLLFGRERVAVDHHFASLRRYQLNRDAWVEHQPGWLSGHLEVFCALRDTMHWRQRRRYMHKRLVAVPRLLSSWPNPGIGHPAVEHCIAALEARYASAFSAVHLAYYRDGRDSVAPHGDDMGEGSNACTIAIVAVGHKRRFLLRPAGGGGPGLNFELGWGDLLVMGGSCQRDHLHSIPKSKTVVGPRISIQFRPYDPRSMSTRPLLSAGASSSCSSRVPEGHQADCESSRSCLRKPPLSVPKRRWGNELII